MGDAVCNDGQSGDTERNEDGAEEKDGKAETGETETGEEVAEGWEEDKTDDEDKDATGVERGGGSDELTSGIAAEKAEEAAAVFSMEESKTSDLWWTNYIQLPPFVWELN